MKSDGQLKIVNDVNDSTIYDYCNNFNIVTLQNKVLMRLLELKFTSNNAIKSKAIKYIIKKNYLTINKVI